MSLTPQRLTPSRVALYVVPALSVAVVIFALFVVGAPRPYIAARLYGGPTEGAEITGRLQLVQRQEGIERPAMGVAVRVVATRPSDRRGEWTGEGDAEGMADFRIAIGAEAEAGKEKGPVTLIVEDATSGGRLAAGPADLRVEAWRKAARRRGGWIPVQSSGALTIRLAPARGIWAIPFFGALVVQVFDNGEPVAGANVELTSEAADIRQDATRLLTDVRGIAVAELAPREHTAFVRATARSREGKQGVWYGTLPVLPGALHAALVQDELLVESPIPRRIAYYSVVSETGRHTGGSLRLTTNQRGGASGRVQYAALPPGPLWAVVSSEAELDNHAAVGWPLRTRSDEIAYTFDVSDQLLLDGVPRAEANEVTRRRRARWLAVLVCLLAAILIGVLFVTTARSANRTLDAHLKTAGRDIDGVERVAKAHAWQTASVAVLCVALGFAVLALIALYRLS